MKEDERVSLRKGTHRLSRDSDPRASMCVGSSVGYTITFTVYTVLQPVPKFFTCLSDLVRVRTSYHATADCYNEARNSVCSISN